MKIQFKRKKKGNVREDLQNQTMQIGALRNWLEINQQYDSTHSKIVKNRHLPYQNMNSIDI